MLQGMCPLCLQTKEIVTSHLIPAAMYKYFRTENSEPVRITSKGALQTSQQLQYPLLCSNCENLLNRGGENWLLPLLARIDGTFPLHDILSRVPPDTEDGEAKLYAASRNREIHVDKLAHFAMGVFWKSSVHPWSSNRGEPRIAFGKYQEAVRAYLCGDCSFPQKMALVVAVLPPSASQILFCIPYLASKDETHLYAFYIPGIQFLLSVGNRVTQEDRQLCFVSNSLHPILVTDFSANIVGQVAPIFAKARKSPRLIQHFEQMRKR